MNTSRGYISQYFVVIKRNNQELMLADRRKKDDTCITINDFVFTSDWRCARLMMKSVAVKEALMINACSDLHAKIADIVGYPHISNATEFGSIKEANIIRSSRKPSLKETTQDLVKQIIEANEPKLMTLSEAWTLLKRHCGGMTFAMPNKDGLMIATSYKLKDTLLPIIESALKNAYGDEMR